MLELKELKTLHDKAYQANQITREQASDDLVFYWITQWDDQLLSDSQLQYRGQFDIVRKAGRQILSQLRQNPIQPDFKPKNESRDDDAELADGLYRAEDRRLDSQEAYDYASQDSVVCGFGAWELYTEYETNNVGDENQVIRRRYIPEANNNAFCDPNAKKLDKSDARYWSILTKYSEDGYKNLVEELTGERPLDVDIASFKQPEESYTFPWIAESKKIYVTSFYHKERVKETVYTFEDPFGTELIVRESNVNDIMDELVDSGYNVKSEKKVYRWKVTRYIASGKEILSTEAVAGQNIPVIPLYGERTTVEGEEYYEGIVRLAKDPQRLRNFQMSYLADIVSQSPRNKPMFFPEQIQGFEPMYEQNGSDNNYPYYLLNKKTPAGEELPMGPAMQMPDQQIPPALAASIELARQAVEDVANPGLPQDIADPDLSGKAVNALERRLDQQSYIYQHNFKFAKRRDAEIWAGMATEIIDTPRVVTIETPDGQTKKVHVMETVIDRETGDPVVINDLTNMEFDVYAEIGQEYSSQKEQTRTEMAAMAAALDPNDPLRKILTMKTLDLMDGVELDDVKKYIHKQLIMQGIKEPDLENPEDMKIVQEMSQQQGQPDAATILAMAEDKKAQADMLQQQRGFMKDKADIIIDRTGTQIDAFNAETNRAKVVLDAREKNVSIQNKSIEGQGKLLDNQKKFVEIEEAQIDNQIAGMSTEDLISAMMGVQ